MLNLEENFSPLELEGGEGLNRINVVNWSKMEIPSSLTNKIVSISSLNTIRSRKGERKRQ
jgi:hypothetical protein